MYKAFKLAVLFAFFSSIIAQAMGGGIRNAIIKNGIVEGATHYHLIRGGITRVWDRTPEPVDVYNRPEAFFYRHNSETRENNFLGAVEVDAFDKPTLAKLDTMVDPRVSLPIITKATIAYCIKRGRMITFLDRDGNFVDEVSHYDGPTDI